MGDGDRGWGLSQATIVPAYQPAVMTICSLLLAAALLLAASLRLAPSLQLTLYPVW